jgi:glycosyltransferase involved in cell wall biosynthesis
MAMGATVITTKLGALPETLAGYGAMVEPDEAPDRLAARFAATVIATLKSERLLPAAAAARRQAQIAYIRENYLWPRRAREWEQWLAQLTGGTT